MRIKKLSAENFRLLDLLFFSCTLYLRDILSFESKYFKNGSLFFLQTPIVPMMYE